MIHIPINGFFTRTYAYFLVFQGVQGGRPTVFSTWSRQREPITTAAQVQTLIEAQNAATPGYERLTLLHWALMDGAPDPHQVEALERLVARLENLAALPADLPLTAELLRDASGAVCGWYDHRVLPASRADWLMHHLAAREYRPARGVVCTGAGHGLHCGTCLACQVRQLRAEALALRDDAARHRYLRDVAGLRYKAPGQPLAQSAADSDAAIDAARALH